MRQSYIQALTKALLPYWHRVQLFMQDDVRVHTATVTRDFLNQHYINPIDWPAYLRDLNLIKHLR
jgi:hypothetical protein